MSNLTIKDFYPVPGKSVYICEIVNWTDREITTEIKTTGEGFENIKSVTIPGRKTVEVEIKPDRDSQYLKAELMYSDGLKPDNNFYFQKERTGEKKILLVGSDDTSIFYTKSSVESAGTISVDVKKIEELQQIFLGKYRTISDG